MPLLVGEIKQSDDALSALQAIQDKARKVAPDLRAMANSIFSSDENRDTLNARYNDLATNLVDAGVGFQNVFVDTFEAETNIDINAGDTLSLEDGLLALDASQRREFISFARRFISLYVLLLKL